MTEQVKQQKTNYEIFMETVMSLRHSQGFYSRLAASVEELDANGRKQLEEELNSKPQWNDSVDCVLFLEQ